MKYGLFVRKEKINTQCGYGVQWTPTYQLILWDGSPLGARVYWARIRTSLFALKEEIEKC